MREARPKRQQSSKNYQYLLHSDENKQKKNTEWKRLTRTRQASDTDSWKPNAYVFNFSINFTPTINCHVFVRALHWRSFAFPSSSVVFKIEFTFYNPYFDNCMVFKKPFNRFLCWCDCDLFSRFTPAFIPFRCFKRAFLVWAAGTHAMMVCVCVWQVLFLSRIHIDRKAKPFDYITTCHVRSTLVR